MTPPRTVLYAALLTVVIAARGGAQTTPTLRQVLAEHARGEPARELAGLDAPITSFAVHDSSDALVIAYYVRTSDQNALGESLYVARLDKRSRRWDHAAIPTARSSKSTGDAPLILGSVLGIHRTRTRIYLDTHVNPSAGIVVVLDDKLRPVATLYGWVLRTLPNDVAIYHRSEIHFAPLHPAEVWLYDPSSGRNTVIYPRTPYDRIRRDYASHVKDVYAGLGEAWFRSHNYPMDPELFDSAVGDTVVTSPNGDRAAFVVTFGDRDASVMKLPVVDVAVACRDLRSRVPRCAETEMSALRSAHPDWPVARILTSLVR